MARPRGTADEETYAPEEETPENGSTNWAPEPMWQEPSPVGQTVAVPMWNAHNDVGSARLRVQRVEIDGSLAELGYMAQDSTIDQLIARWPKAGTYLVMPVNHMAQQLQELPMKFTVPEDHEILTKVRMVGAAPGAAAMLVGGGQQIPPEIWSMVNQIQVRSDEEIRRVREERDRLVSEMASERDRISKERLSLAVSHANDASEIQGKILDAEQSRAATAQERLLTIMNAQREAEQRAWERRMEQAKLEEAAKQRAHEHMLTREREARDAEAKRFQAIRDEERRSENARRKQEAEENARREKEREERIERQREQDRQHFQLMVETLRTKQEAGDPISAITKLLENGAPLLETARALGIDRLLGGGEQTLAQTIAGTVGELAKAAVDFQKVQGGSMGMLEDHGEEMVAVPGPDGQLMHIPAAQWQEALQQQEAALRAQGVVPGIQGPVQGQLDPSQVPGAPGPGPQPVPVQAVPGQPAPSPIQQQRLQTVQQLPPAILRDARRALRAGVIDLRSKPKGEWTAAITQMVMGAPAIVEYIRVMAIKPAILEAGADEDMATNIVGMIDNSGLVPADIPRF